MKHFTTLLAVSLALICGQSLAAEPEVVRPLIWVTPADRAPILKKIESQPWAKAVFEAMQARVKQAVAEHEDDPDEFLRGLPLVKNKANPKLHPTLERGRATGLQHYLLIGEDCGVLYFLTQDEAYARCAADILNATVEAMAQMKPSDGANGGLINSDHLYEARNIGAQVPILYDFIYSYLKSGKTVYNVATQGQQPFNFDHAQSVFRTYARLAIEHGLINCNWPVLEMPSLAHNVLALDNAAERTRLLEHVLTKNTAHQDSLSKVVAEYSKAGAVWPESLQYSGGVSSLSTYLVALMRRQHPPAPLPENYANLPLSLARLGEMRFPNGDNIRFGDGPRRGGGSMFSFEIAYALGQREGDARLQEIFGGLINLAIQEGNYNRANPHAPATGANPNLSPLQLLWFAPEISGSMTAPAIKTTDELPFVGAVLQRNLAPDKNPNHAFMAVVSGGAHVHSHASGMALELYGAGEVLGTDSGKGNYGADEHENYRRLFAAFNCVIVNGASRSDGGWANLGINTVQPVALEPALGAKPVSPNNSFTLTSFSDDKGPGAKAKQERLVGIVRTSPTTGFYVDVFRSRSALPKQFHDYLYHNIGEAPSIATAGGELPLTASPGRFVPVTGAKWEGNRSYLFPGWHVFKDAKTSAPTAEDVTVDFSVAKLKPAPAHMKLFIPGAAGREYSQARAPYTKDAPSPYDHETTPVLVVRQRGEAWTKPFAVIYEPFAGDKNSGSIQSVTAIGDQKIFAGFKVVSKINGHALTQYVLVQPTATGVFADEKLGIEFRGRYAVISVNESGECTSLYLGEGSRLRFQNYDLKALDGATTAASAEINGATAIVTANAPAELTLPGGGRVVSTPVNPQPR